jgi:hypothetical protein
MKTAKAAYNAWGLLFLSLMLAGCGLTGANPVPPTPTVSPVISDALQRDAETMATQLGISVDQALLRFSAQDAIGALNAELEQREAATFAGLWIQQAPVYRVVVAFTRNGPQTIRPYVEHTSLAGLIEVRTAKTSLSELSAAQQQASQLVQELGFPFSTSINVEKNQVEVYVTDRALFEASLHKANLQLPQHVVMVVIYEPLRLCPKIS